LKITVDEILFTELLPEMFERVGLKKSDINDLTKLPNWFTSKKWTTQDEKAFYSWLVPHLKKRLVISKLEAMNLAKAFIFQYGWSTGVEKQGVLF